MNKIPPKSRDNPVNIFFMCFFPYSGARLRGRTATQRSKKVLRRFWEGFWGRILGKGSQKGSEKGPCYGFYSTKGF